MKMLRSGRMPGSVAPVCARLSVCLALLLLSACASRKAQHSAGPHYVAAPSNARIAAYHKTTQPVVIEDDGIEAQAAPPRRLRHEPDNPFEPFSPNYGSVPAAMGDDSSDTEAEADIAPDAFDPFLDGPQWEQDNRDGGANPDHGTAGRQVRTHHPARRFPRPQARLRQQRLSATRPTHHGYRQ